MTQAEATTTLPGRSMTLQRDTLKSFTDAAADAVARTIAGLQRDARHERELLEAEYRARLAEIDARIASVAVLERQVSDRLASLKDGEPGRDGLDGKDGRDGLDGKPGEQGAPGAAGKDGLEGKDGRDGIDGKDGLNGADGKDGERGAAGADGRDGKDGERGPEGAAGKLPVIRSWEDRVYYEAESVTKDGSVYQALRDTGRSPPNNDWICIASAGSNGADGRSIEVRGTYKEDGEYFALNVVVLNGGSFVAKRDNPGPCPGEGWQLMASQGKQGRPGERGAPGQKGDRGDSSPAVVSVDLDAQGLFRLTNADGSVVDADLYPVLSRIG